MIRSSSSNVFTVTMITCHRLLHHRRCRIRSLVAAKDDGYRRRTFTSSSCLVIASRGISLEKLFPKKKKWLSNNVITWLLWPTP
mmetsp:Transcript_8478/g.10266  ORF Transcript_8478/g.10266 Transcript_8478/m.10266 type:complete len:84 (+) Transcript_8478:1014-1265(+)